MNPLLQKIQAQLRRPGLWNIGRLLSASVFAQVLSIGIAPIVTRLYTSEEYGFLALFGSFSAVLGVLATLQFSQVVLLPADDKEAEVAFSLCVWLSSFTALVSLLAIVLTYPWLAEWFKFRPELRFWFFLLPVSVFSSGVGSAAGIWANRKQHYRLLTRGRIIAAVTSSICSVGLGLVWNGPSGLLIGLMLSNLMLTLVIWMGIRKEISVVFAPIGQVKKVANQYRQFPLYSTPAEFIGQFIGQMPVFFLTTFLGPASAGLYSLCNRVLLTPIQLVSSAVSEVFRQRAASMYQSEGRADQIYRRTFLYLFVVACIPFLVLLVFAPDLFAFVFGEKWRASGILAQVLTAMFFFRFIVSPVSYIYVIAQRQGEDLLNHLYLLTSSILIFTLLRDRTIFEIMGAFSANYTFIYLFVLFRGWRLSKGKKLNNHQDI